MAVLLFKPTHAKDEVLIKIEGAGLNPMDWKMHDFNAMVPSYPYVFGGDIAGKVEKIPDNVGFEEAARLPVCSATMIIGLMLPMDYALNPTSSMNCTGDWWQHLHWTFAIQVLKFLGFSNITTYGSNKHADYVTSLSATKVLDRFTVSLPELSYSVSQSDIVVDAIGTLESQNTSRDWLKEGGGWLNTLIRLQERIEERLKKEGKNICNVFGAYQSVNMTKYAVTAFLNC
ncbi:hypothetical protein BT69DRAFT_1359105 [Atractiella rhizophila]|nr:hypothetical protein BT69DRAFT_1359105 [Atractiella rhizophila]